MGKKKKRKKEKESLYFRREFERTAISDSGTQCMVVTYIAFSKKKNTKSYLLNQLFSLFFFSSLSLRVIRPLRCLMLASDRLKNARKYFFSACYHSLDWSWTRGVIVY